MAEDNKDKIISLLKTRGPMVPNEIKKLIGGDTMILGAILSELVSRGFVAITHLKKGASPFYYVPGQEQKLEQFVEYLNPKDQKTLQRLKTVQVLQDKGLELFERVSLRQIKDYAKPFSIKTSQGDVLFWRYYLIGEEEALAILKEKFSRQQQFIPGNTQSASQPQSQSLPTPEQQTPQQPVQEQPKVQEEPRTPEPAKSEPEVPKAKIVTNIEQAKEVEAQQKLKTKSNIEQTAFYEEVHNYFTQTNIDVVSEEQIAKNREYEFIIDISSAVGTIRMLCVARNKKKLTQNDVAPALLKAKQKDLQCLFLTNGEFSKKSLELIEKEYKGVTVKTL